MIRYAVRCPGCDEAMSVRFGADSTKGTRFYFACPNCELPIRGSVRGDDIHTFQVQFQAEEIDYRALHEKAKVVTVNPFMPADSNADSLKAFGGSMTFTLHGLLGDRVMEFMAQRSNALEAIGEIWPPARRLYEYYLSENWGGFDATISRSFSDWNLPSGNTVHERATRAHQPSLAATWAVVPPGDATTRFLERFMMKHQAATKQIGYRSYLKNEAVEGRIQALQRSVFDVVDLFISRHEMWLMGGMFGYLESGGVQDLERMTLARDEFGETRDLYQQAFEVLAKTLRYPLAAQNAVKRQDLNDFGGDHPPLVPVKQQPKSIAAFEKLSSAYKIAYLAQVPGWTAYAGILDSKTRNTIGHASARHDLRSGRVINEKDPTGITYMSFLGGIYNLFDALSVSLQVLRSVRITSSSDWEAGRGT